jgi:glycosyltransferase involved in cell wall biosynthesis
VLNRVAVVVPAHNEAGGLAACVDSVRRATAKVAAATARVTVEMIVVADACTDDTAAEAARAGATVITVDEANVGRARATGMSHALRHGATWLATTDADSLVPSGWLAWHIAHAAAGTHVLVGEVRVADWSPHPPLVRDRYERHYAANRPHVHGANLGCDPRTYTAVGGFDALAVGEDHDLVARARRAGHRVVHDGRSPVVTSARRAHRAPNGFGAFLESLRQR